MPQIAQAALEREGERIAPLPPKLGDKDEKTGRFVPGNSGFGGRPKGSRNRLGEAFVSDLERDWLQGGPETIERVRRDDPSTYLRVVAGILPKELNVTVSVLDTMSDDDLLTLLQGLRERRRHQQAKTIEGSVSDRQALLSGTDDGQASRKP